MEPDSLRSLPPPTSFHRSHIFILSAFLFFFFFFFFIKWMRTKKPLSVSTSLISAEVAESLFPRWGILLRKFLLNDKVLWSHHLFLNTKNTHKGPFFLRLCSFTQKKISSPSSSDFALPMSPSCVFSVAIAVKSSPGAWYSDYN